MAHGGGELGLACRVTVYPYLVFITEPGALKCKGGHSGSGFDPLAANRVGSNQFVATLLVHGPWHDSSRGLIRRESIF